MSDLRSAVRGLVRSPGYTLLALLTLVLGLGMNTAVFSLVRGVLLAPLPWTDPHELMVVREVNGHGREMRAAWKNFVDWQGRTGAFSALAAYQSGESSVLGADAPLRANVAVVSDGFFDVLRVPPARGRTLQPADHRRGAVPVVVVSHRFWQTQLGGRTDRLLSVDGFDARIVGVLPPGLEHPADADVWYPLELHEQSEHRTAHNYLVVGRLRPGASPAQADADLDAITRGFRAELVGADLGAGFRDYFPHEVNVRSLHEYSVGAMQRPLAILLGASLMLLLVGCTNLASTTLARATARERELAVRHALGAGRGRLIRLQLVETGLLAVVGALLGFALGGLALRALPLFAPAGLPRLDTVRLDPVVALFTLALALVVTLASGVWPGVRAAGGAAGALRGGGRTGSGPGARRAWQVLIGVEVALALLLLVASGLLVRSFITVLRIAPGYHVEGLLTATVDPPSTNYAEPADRLRYYEALHARLQQIPGVADVGLVSGAPLEGVPDGLLQVTGGVAELSADYQIASDGYFRALGIALERGRTFDARDRAGSAPVAVVSRSFAQAAWPGADPIGQQVSSGGMEDSTRWASVVGVVADVRQADLTREPRPTVYLTYRQRPMRTWSMTAVLRPAAGDAAALVAPVRAAVAGIDGDVPVRFATIEQRLARTLTQRRFVLLVIGAFSTLALGLAAIGVYGVVSYAVTRRRREIGIRLALGGQRLAVMRGIQRDYLLPAAVGAGVGTAAALAFTRVLESMLYQVRPTDPLTFIAVLGVLAVTAWLASFVPALRTTRIGPLETMKAE